ncbi:UbiA family prenyltransferase [Prosthecobacter sp.]|uniref:UbiA family prenyltransferase n=1 Tax=Prosthecobacter sp. TaxID=1965333 RepID=UPI002ABCA23A|nr:UbiA family prenyltransferase [Prosthecobacter sp.]MDZ4405534.1 UbiA family prenyltransferase [Prosthecobacter sp.]
MRPWLHLARISNLPTVWTNVTAAWLLTGGTLTDPRLYWLILAGSLLYTGGMILNDAADVKFDREHRKERPIPSGQVSLNTAWIVSIAMLIVGATLATWFGANPRITAILVAAIVFYDLYHKQWAGSVIIMGACRMLLYLMAASAAPAAALPAAAALGCYVVGITIAARLEHKNGALPAASSMLALALLYTPGIVFAMRFASAGGYPMQLVILAAFAILIAYATQMLRKGGPAIGQAVGTLLAGIAIVDALAVSSVSTTVALGFVALAPVLRLWQRWVAAT